MNGCHYRPDRRSPKKRIPILEKLWLFVFMPLSILAMAYFVGIESSRGILATIVAVIVVVLIVIFYSWQKDVEEEEEEKNPLEDITETSKRQNNELYQMREKIWPFKDGRKLLSASAKTIIDQIETVLAQEQVFTELLKSVPEEEESFLRDCNGVFRTIIDEFLQNAADAQNILLIMKSQDDSDGITCQKLLKAEIESNQKKIELLERLSEQLAIKVVREENPMKNITHECFVEALERQNARSIEAVKTAQIVSNGGSAFMKMAKHQTVSVKSQKNRK